MIPLQESLLFGTPKLRYFLWHLNECSYPVEIAILGQLILSDSDVVLQNAREQVWFGPSSDLSYPGICLAAAHLFNVYDQVSLPNLSGIETVIWSANVNPGQICAVTLEFDVPVIGDVLFTWTATRKFPEQTWTLFGDLLATPGEHIRGYWPHSSLKLRAPGPPFDVSPGTDTKQIGICEQTGPEHETSSAFGPWIPLFGAPVKANKGAYGGNLTYHFDLFNPTGINQNIYVYATPRNAGIDNAPSKYWGACRIVHPYSLPPRTIPVIYRRKNINEYLDHERNYVELTEGMPTGHIVPPGESSIEVEIANGGACNLPANIILTKNRLPDLGIA